MARERAEHTPNLHHLPHLPTPGEILRSLRCHRREITFIVALLGGTGIGVVGAKMGLFSGGHPESSNPSQPGITQLQKPPEVGGLEVEITPYPTSTPQPEVTATPTATASPTKEAEEPFDCGGQLKPETCKTAEYIQWIRFDGQKLTGVAAIAEPGEDISIPKALQVSKTKIDQPNTYHGVLIVGKTMDNSETYQFMGAFDTDNLGTKNLPAGKIGTIIDKQPVFNNTPYNLVLTGPDKFMENFARIMRSSPRIIDNEIPSDQAPGGGTFYGIPIPTPTPTPKNNN